MYVIYMGLWLYGVVDIVVMGLVLDMLVYCYDILCSCYVVIDG